MNMTKSEQATSGTRSVAAFFTTRQAAETAKADAIGTGVSAEAVKITDGHGTITGNAAATPRESTGLLATIKHHLTQDQHSDEAIAQRPGFVVTAHVPATSFDAVREVLAREGEITDV